MLICKKLGYNVYEEFQLKRILFHKTKTWEKDNSIYNFKSIVPVYFII